MAKHEVPKVDLTGTTPVSSPDKAKIARLIIGYQAALLVVAAALNLLLLGVTPAIPGLPEQPVLIALVLALCMLVANHMWLMTATELARLRHDIFTTPEEWAAAGRSEINASRQGRDAVQRCHNAHRNTTENTVLFALVAAVFALSTPSVLAACVWIGGFGVARLGYTYSYLTARTGWRGGFMSASLLALYGMASHLALALFL